MKKKSTFNIKDLFTKWIILIVLGVGLYQPINQIISNFLDEDIELLETMDEEDSERESDDFEELQVKHFNTTQSFQFATISNLNPTHYFYFQLKSQHIKGVQSPPPELTMC